MISDSVPTGVVLDSMDALEQRLLDQEEKHAASDSPLSFPMLPNPGNILTGIEFEMACRSLPILFERMAYILCRNLLKKWVSLYNFSFTFR